MKVNRLGNYEDVKQVLDAALAAGGGSYKLETHGKAVHWRHRVYKFRKLFAAALGGGVSPYDKLTFPSIPKESSTVIIKLQQPEGIFTPASAAEDSTMAEALALAKRLSGDIV